MRTLAEVLLRAADSPHGVTFAEGQGHEERFTYAAIAERARTAAAALRTLGVAAGERVGLVLPTGVAFYDAFFGCVLAGIVPVPLYPPLRLGRLDEYHERTASMLRAVDARLVVTDARVAKVLGETLTRAQPARGWVLASELLAAREPWTDTPSDEDALAFVQFSSGTTSAPKAVTLTHRQIITNVRAILDAIDAAHPLTPPERHSCVSWLPLYHDMGLIGCVLAAMAYPGDVTLLPPERFIADPASWLRTIAAKRATISASPSFGYALAAERVDASAMAGVDLSSWRVALNGAEPVAPQALQRFGERFTPLGLRPDALTPVYGLAEATVAVTFSTLNAAWSQKRFDTAKLANDGVAVADAVGIPLVTLGKPVASIELRIIGADGALLEANRLGRIEIRGPSVTRGYLGDPPRAPDVWLDTGDTGFLHDGELYLYGRTKDMIVLRGRKYAPHDIEHALAGAPGVRSGCVAAVGLTGERGEELYLFVEQRHGAVVDTGDVRNRIGAATGFTDMQIVVLTPGSLPRTSSGKISRSETARRYAAGTLTAPRRPGLLQLGAILLRSGLALARTRGGR